jgi:hypothetical protein
MRYFVPPSLAGGINGTWTQVNDGTYWYLNRAAASGTLYLSIPIAVPHQNTVSNRGSRFTSLEVYYQVSDAPLTSLAVEFNLQELPAGAEFAEPTNPAFTYDTSHDTAGERITEGNHTMTLTLSSILWLAGTQYLRADLIAVADASAIFRFWGAMLHYTLRV